MKMLSKRCFLYRTLVFLTFLSIPRLSSYSWSVQHREEYDTTVSSTNMSTATQGGLSVDFPLCFVHVGKASGSTISCGLGLAYANCEGMPRPATPETYAFHLKRNDCPQETATYLVALRNPISRIKSWFRFEKEIVPGKTKDIRDRMKAKRDLLFDCFDNLESLALALTTNITISGTYRKEMSCPERAWAAIVGARAFSYHEFYNYEHYWLGATETSSTSDATWKALRTEHLEEDWRSISNNAVYRHVNKVEGGTEETLSETALKNLCAALCSELQYYKKFLKKASNLSPGQVAESISEVQQQCPEETIDVRECLATPQFPLVPTPRRIFDQQTKKRFLQPF